jgi:hypothetical protein
MGPTRAGHSILVVAADPVLAALLGGVVESARYAAAFPAIDERPDQALARIRPLAAILLNAEERAAQSDLFVSRARQLRVPIILFGSREAMERSSAWAAQHGIPRFALPEQLDALREALGSLEPIPRHR